MRTTLSFFAVCLLFTFCSGPQKPETNEPAENFPVGGKVERYSTLLDEVIPADVVPEVLADGFSWSEGPLWIEEIEAIIFSDVPENKIYQWKEEEGLSVYLQPSGYNDTTAIEWQKGSNGLALSPDGRLIICQHGDRRVVYMDAPLDNPMPQFTSITSKIDEMPYNSPNDLTVSSDGSIYFTDPPYGLYGQDDDVHKELEYNGIYRVKDGETLLLIDSLTRPNGIGLSPDERKLYVANSDNDAAFWAVYDLLEDGTIESGKVFYDATSKVPSSVGMPDGLEFHPNGWLFATGPGGLHVFSPDGELLGIIVTDGFVSNCAFDSNFDYIYMTVDDRLMRLELKGIQGEV